MNKLLPILLVVVLSGCSSEPQVHSTTEPMYFMCGSPEGLPVIVDIKSKSIVIYIKSLDRYVQYTNSATYYYVYNYETKRLDYILSGNELVGDELMYSRWLQNASGDHLMLDEKYFACDRVQNHKAYFNN